VVEVFAARRRRRTGVADLDYRALHRQVLECCRSLASQSDAEQQGYYQSLAELVRPWLSLYVLAQTQRKILADLLANCRRAEGRLLGRGWSLRLPGWLAPAAAFLAAVGVVLLAPGLDRLVAPVAAWLMSWAHLLYVIYHGTSAGQRWLMGGIVLIMSAIYAVLHARMK
jgi:hypothetical protein